MADAVLKTFAVTLIEDFDLLGNKRKKYINYDVMQEDIVKNTKAIATATGIMAAISILGIVIALIVAASHEHRVATVMLS